MAAMRPLDPSVLREQVSETVDDLIEKIEDSLPTIRKLCRKQKKQKKAPTDRISPEAKERLKELSENPILNDEGTDFRPES